MRSFAIILSLLWLLGAATACQAFAPTAPPPTVTPVLLPREVQATATPQPATPTPTVMAEPTAVAPQPTTTVAPAAVKPGATAPVRLMAVGRRASLILRGRPAANAAVVAQSAGSAVVWVEGRAVDGRWLWVAYGDSGAHAWVAAADVQVFGELATVSVTDATGVAQAAPVPAGGAAATAAPRGDSRTARPPVATRPPAQPQLTGKIAFQTASGGDIYLMDANGANLRRITDGMDPALSPDGTQLAFARWSAPHGIFAIDLRTGVERRVVSADRPRSPSWQADGSTLAFTQVSRDVTCLDTPLGCFSEAAVRRQFGGQECLQTPAGRFCIGDFSVRQIQETGLAQASASGENRLDLPALNDAQSPVWHPQRAEVLYRGGGGLQVTAPNGETRSLLQDPALNSPAWSPDGQRIAVQVALHDNTDIFLLDAAGNRLARLTAPATATAPAPDNVAPAWSPDGRYLIFLSNRDGAWRLYRMNADGSGQVPLAPAALGDIQFRYDYAAERVASWSR